jgi:hypothetical protein
MKKKTDQRKDRDDLRPEYTRAQLKQGVRGKYLHRYRAGTNLVLLSPDVAEHFRDERSVNSALRRLIAAGKHPFGHTR